MNSFNVIFQSANRINDPLEDAITCMNALSAPTPTIKKLRQHTLMVLVPGNDWVVLRIEPICDHAARSR
jgi:hypothetical protein